MSLMNMIINDEKTSINLIPLFPTLIVKLSNFITEKECSEIYQYIQLNKKIHKSHGQFEGDAVSTHEYSQRFNDPYEPPFNFLTDNLKKRLQAAVSNYCKETGMQNFAITNFWSNIMNKGSVLKEHQHPQSSVSGALYINVGHGSSICFHNPNPYVSYTNWGNRYTDYNLDDRRVEVYNRELVLFPSWLKHGKNDYYYDMDDRVMVSFNA